MGRKMNWCWLQANFIFCMLIDYIAKRCDERSSYSPEFEYNNL